MQNDNEIKEETIEAAEEAKTEEISEAAAEADTESIPEEAAEAAPAKKLTRKERRRLWKEAKKEKRREQKEFYKNAPLLTKAWNLYIKKPFVALLIFALAIRVILIDFDYMGVIRDAVLGLRDFAMSAELTEEQIEEMYELSPIDEEGAERIASLPALNEGESWTICLYFVGADLEDDGENDLSYLTSVLRNDKLEENRITRREGMLENINRFSEELEGNGLELPQFFFYPEIPVISEAEEKSPLAERQGAASADIEEIVSDTWSDNINIVIQTGGATRWSNRQVNPNRTQRFLYSKGRFREIENLALQPSSEPETLSDFMSYCASEYPADHSILILWDHGSGAFGYGNDAIYGESLSLKDIRSALESSFGAGNINNPHYDIIGFDACLMSTLEVTEALYGYADYYALSEEVEPGYGWDYGAFLSAMSEDQTMNPARVAQAIADTYTDFYMENNIKDPFHHDDVTFSVIDASSAHKLYSAYAELCRAQLKDAVSDLKVLTDIGLYAKQSTRFSGVYYKEYNMVDLGNYAVLLSDNYPKECIRINELIGEAVLYHRENGCVSDATGIAMYIPAEVSDLSGLIYYLDYIYNISEDDDITALYYYKQAGCLNDELKEYVRNLTGKEPEILDVAPLNDFGKTEPVIDGNGFYIPLDSGMESLIADYALEVGSYDEEADTVTYYGRDRLLHLDGEGNLTSDFDGYWLFMDDVPLSLELVSSTPSATEYRSHITYNSDDAYLTLSLDKESGDVTITGVRKVQDEEYFNYLVNTRTNETLEDGAVITPVYEESNFTDNSVNTKIGKDIDYSADTKVEMKLLPEGYYICSAVLSDQRGDSYYSGVIGADISESGIKEWSIDSRFYGSDY